MKTKGIVQKLFHTKKNVKKVEKHSKSILLVWDVAGISAILAKYLKKRGYIADVILREGYDKFNILDFYEIKTLNLRGSQFLKYAVKKAKDYVQAGGDVEAIKTKYKLTASQEKALINERKANIKEA